MLSRRFGARASALVAVVATLAIAGCSSPTASQAPGSSTNADQPSAAATQVPESEAAESRAAEATAGTTLTACELVSPADIEAVLGLDPASVGEGSLEQTPSVGPGVNECQYDDEPWGGLVVSLYPTTGDKAFDAVATVYGDDAEALEIGDGALWFESNDRGYFLKDTVMAILQFTSIADGTEFREPTISLGQALIDKI